MIPQLLISADQKNINKYLKSIIKQCKIRPYYYFELRPEKKTIGIDDIKELIKICRVTASDKRLFFIEGINLATVEAQNAFLKTLEESSDNNIFILSATSLGGVLPTIVSRSSIVKPENPLPNDLQIDDILDRLRKTDGLSVLADDRMVCSNKESALKVIDGITAGLHKGLMSSPVFNAKAARHAVYLRQKLIDHNLNPQLTVDILLIFIFKLYTIKKDG